MFVMASSCLLPCAGKARPGAGAHSRSLLARLQEEVNKPSTRRTYGDGIDDAIVGAYWFDYGQMNEGRAFVPRRVHPPDALRPRHRRAADSLRRRLLGLRFGRLAVRREQRDGQ